MFFEIWKKTKNTYSRTLYCAMFSGNDSLFSVASTTRY